MDVDHLPGREQDSLVRVGAPARRLSTIERAYELARGGTCASVRDIAKRLIAEGYEAVTAHLGAPTLQRQLGVLCRESVAAAAAAGEVARVEAPDDAAVGAAPERAAVR